MQVMHGHNEILAACAVIDRSYSVFVAHRFLFRRA